MKQLVLDTSLLIALFYAKDTYHQDSLRGFKQLNQLKTKLLTPIPIIFEVYKWLLHRGGVNLAQMTFEVMNASLYPVDINQVDFAQLQAIIGNLPQWGGTLEDATVILLAQRYKCPIWTLNYRDLGSFKQLQFWTPE